MTIESRDKGVIYKLMKLLNILDVRKSIHRKIFLSFIFVTMILSVMIGVSSYYISVNILTQKVSSSFSDTVLYIGSGVKGELNKIKQLADYIYINKDLKEAILKKNSQPFVSADAKDRVKEKLNDYLIATTFNNLKVIKIYGLDSFEMSFGDSVELKNLDNREIINSQWYKEAMQNSTKTLWAGRHESFSKEPNISSKYSISLFNAIKDQYFQKNIGVMYMNFDSQIFSNLTDKLNYTNKSEIYILDNNNEVVNNYKSRITSEEIDSIIGESGSVNHEDYFIKKDAKNKKMYFCYFINDFNWKVVGMIPISELTRDNKEIFNATVIAFLISFAFSGIIWFFISSSIVEPIKRLTQATKAVRNGNFNIKVQYSSKNELGTLTSNFNYMVEKINDLLKQVIEENNRIKDAEYKALQAQINPHFLYNTLNSIRWMAILQKADNIKKVVDALGRLLRNSTNKVDTCITIGEEIDNLKDYLYIQKIAYKNKFHVEWNVEEDILQYKCIKFILQPLLENAIFHGILPKEKYGNIWIKVSRQEDSIVFSVKDDGVGMSIEQISNLQCSENETNKKFNGIGINNINERIQMTYEGKGNLTIASIEGEYTNIVINIPIIP